MGLLFFGLFKLPVLFIVIFGEFFTILELLAELDPVTPIFGVNCLLDLLLYKLVCLEIELLAEFEITELEIILVELDKLVDNCL